MTDRHCFAPCCSSGSRNYKKVSLFKVPKNMLKVWTAAVPRKDKKLTINNALCEKHFLAEDIIREVKTETYSYPLKIPRLKENAIPCIWPGCPSYLSKTPAKKRRIIEKKEYDHITAECRKMQNEVFDKPSTSKGYQEEAESTYLDINHCDIKIELSAEAPEDKLRLHELFNILHKKTNEITLPSESWTIKYYSNIVAIFEIAAIKEDIVTTKKILITKCSIKFFVFQHLYDDLTEDSFKICSFNELEKQILDFHRLTICFGYNHRDYLSLDFSRTRYRKDESSKSVRHENCKYILSGTKNLLQNDNCCRLCINAKYSIRHLKKNTQAIKAKKIVRQTNCIRNMRQRVKRAHYRIELLKKKLNETAKKVRTMNEEDIGTEKS